MVSPDKSWGVFVQQHYHKQSTIITLLPPAGGAACLQKDGGPWCFFTALNLCAAGERCPSLLACSASQYCSMVHLVKSQVTPRTVPCAMTVCIIEDSHAGGRHVRSIMDLKKSGSSTPLVVRSAWMFSKTSNCGRGCLEPSMRKLRDDLSRS